MSPGRVHLFRSTGICGCSCFQRTMTMALRLRPTVESERASEWALRLKAQDNSRLHKLLI